MTRLRRRASIQVSLLVLAGLAAAAVAQPATASTHPAAAVPETTQPAILGTDVSGYTTVTSWPSVKAAGLTFAGVQAFDGAEGSNPLYHAEVTGALAAGLFVLPYIVADPLKVSGADQFTKKAWPVIKGIAAAPYQTGGQYLPIALDLEPQSDVTPKACYGLSPAQMRSWISAFIAAARSDAHITPLIYTTASWWQACTGGSTAYGGAPLWIADYSDAVPRIPAGWTGDTFWQKAAGTTVSGIQPGEADLDQLEGTVSAKAATTGSFQVRTLSSLAGDAGTGAYAAASTLPKGVTLAKSGKLSWSRTTPVGALAVTIAASGATPAALSLRLLVHAPITIAVAKRSSTVGKKVSLHVTATGADKNHGYPPALKASGLPPGLTMNASGLVTGKPAKTGSWAVTVTATDNLDGTGSAAFAWTIKK